MALTPLKLFRGDSSGELVESFSGFTDLEVGSGAFAAYAAGTPVLVNDGDSASLPFGALAVGDELLDHSDPLAPAVLEAGTYWLLATVLADAPLSPGGYVAVEADLIALGGVGQVSVLQQSEIPELGASSQGIAVCNAGDQLYARVYNSDGLSARTFTLYGTVVKIA